jgi:hypothetical protein
MTWEKDAAAIRAEIQKLQTRAEQLQLVTTATPVTGGTVQQTGWLCPACGRGNAPLNMTCPCKPWPEMRITC